MRLPRNTILSVLFQAFALAAFGQAGTNSIPKITGQLPLSTDQNVPITIRLDDLIVTDSDDTYPIGFSLQLYAGKNYTFQNSTVTPARDFRGDLTVPVTVNDGKNDSKRFDLKIKVNQVENVRPVITGQIALSITSGETITIELSHLIVTDPDNQYPEDFTLKVFAGNNYSVKGQTVTPDPTFVGTLLVPVTVDDGKDESEKYNLEIKVVRPPNIPPVIVGQQTLSTNEDQSITIQLPNLQVIDPDNNYPKDFTLKIYAGDNYTFSGNTITPSANYNGTLSVIISVNDGTDESATFPLQVTIRPVNDAPVITGQIPLSTYVDTPITIAFANLFVTDPDNIYPEGFSLKISNGFNYKVSGTTITPAANFTGTLTATITVDDGSASSQPFPLEIRVLDAPNVAPVIVGQKPISITQGSALTVQFSHLEVYDPDNSYPKDFTLRVLSGPNYTFSGTTVTPLPAFIGTLSVRVSVNDGTANSEIFNLQVEVVPTTVTPQIIGQEALFINEDEPVTILLDDLIVSDADDTYPLGFTLQVLPGKDYTTNNHTVTPALNLNGFLTVSVTVTDDDKNQSAPFNLVILINPVNDPPVITKLETTPLSYEPGTDPISITAIFEVADVDNDHLNLAEISIGSDNYAKGFDELIFNNTANISGFFDEEAGKLLLIGYATLPEYTAAIRSIKYKYNLTIDENPNTPTILPGNRTLSFQVNDGQLLSELRKRNIIMETTVALDIPNAFTPNGDGANETWNVNALSNANQCKNAVISVYNKRGLLLFQTTGLERQWDGTYHGETLPMDTYYYTIDLKLSYVKRTYKGAITILR